MRRFRGTLFPLAPSVIASATSLSSSSLSSQSASSRLWMLSRCASAAASSSSATAAATPSPPPSSAKVETTGDVKARESLQKAKDDMHAKYATEGTASHAVGSMETLDAATKLGFVSSKHRVEKWRGRLPNLSLTMSLTGYAAASYLFPQYMLLPQTLAAGTTGLVALQRLLLRGARAKPVDMRGKVCVVTGASSNGLGRQVAAALVAMGADVIISHRSGTSHDAVEGVVKAAVKNWKHVVPAENGESTAEEFERRIVAWPLTIEDRFSVMQFAGIVRKRFPGGIDVFVQAAGSTPDLGDMTITKNGYEHHIDEGFLSTMHLTEALAPSLRLKKGDASKSKVEGRVIFPVCSAHMAVRAPNLVGTFFAPVKMKTGVNFHNQHQRYIADFGRVCYNLHLAKDRNIHAVLVDPFSCNTMYRRTLSPTSTTLWKPLLLATMMRTPFEGAQSIVHAATSPEVKPGDMVSNCVSREHWKSKQEFNEKACGEVVSWGRAQIKKSASKQKQQQQGSTSTKQQQQQERSS